MNLTEPRSPHPREQWALLLDVDGTLLQIVATPSGVVVPESLLDTLRDLRAALDGALALVSGRSIADLDELFAPLRLPAAGLHGLEHRDAQGKVREQEVPEAALRSARRRLEAFTARHPGTVLEDKGRALALHYRQAPAAADAAHQAVEALARDLGEPFHRQRGKMVVELKSRVASKATSVESFMAEEPFAGRTPVFAGDDVTDEDAFEAVNRLGGISVRVGVAQASAARFALPDVEAVHAWLRHIATTTRKPPGRDRGILESIAR